MRIASSRRHRSSATAVDGQAAAASMLAAEAEAMQAQAHDRSQFEQARLELMQQHALQAQVQKAARAEGFAAGLSMGRLGGGFGMF